MPLLTKMRGEKLVTSPNAGDARDANSGGSALSTESGEPGGSGKPRRQVSRSSVRRRAFGTCRKFDFEESMLSWNLCDRPAESTHSTSADGERSQSTAGGP